MRNNCWSYERFDRDQPITAFASSIFKIFSEIVGDFFRDLQEFASLKTILSMSLEKFPFQISVLIHTAFYLLRRENDKRYLKKFAGLSS